MGHKKIIRQVLVGLSVGVITCAGISCGPPYRFVLTDDGDQVRLTLITQIITSEDLTDEEKREHLRNIGLQDELFINTLVENPDAFTDQQNNIQ
jgi:hypothetical protein